MLLYRYTAAALCKGRTETNRAPTFFRRSAAALCASPSFCLSSVRPRWPPPTSTSQYRSLSLVATLAVQQQSTTNCTDEMAFIIVLQVDARDLSYLDARRTTQAGRWLRREVSVSSRRIRRERQYRWFVCQRKRRLTTHRRKAQSWAATAELCFTGGIFFVWGCLWVFSRIFAITAQGTPEDGNRCNR